MMSPNMVVVVVLLAVSAQTIYAWPSGVAPKACDNMLPQGHGHEHAKPQTSKVPFVFSQDTNSIRSSGKVDFTISQQNGGPPLAAFMVQARQGSSSMPIGVFQAQDSTTSKTIKCANDNDTGSHNSPLPKEKVTFTWSPPTNFKGKVTLYCTVAETKVKFWAHEKCGEVQVK